MNVMFSSKSDEWATPQDFFDKLNVIFTNLSTTALKRFALLKGDSSLGIAKTLPLFHQ